MKKLAEERISINPEICSGKPCIKGTRVAVADILLALAEGLEEKEILRNFRTVRDRDIKAALAYAYCLTDNIPLNISKSSGASVLIDNPLAAKEDLENNAKDIFKQSLAEQAAIQEQITQIKLAELQAKKEAAATPKLKAPDLREFDLEIEIPSHDSIQLFSAADEHEQGLKMDVANYIFEFRDDDEYWLTYSIKDGVEIDRAMKRNIKLTFKHKNKSYEGIYEGYLSTDRQVKVFIKKTDEGKTLGRVL